MSKPELKLDWCSHKAAKFAVMNWHYSRKMPVGKTVKIGVWEGERYKGAVIFSHIVGAMGHRSLGFKNDEACELVRVALCEHVHEVTKIIRIAIKFLRQLCPSLQAIVSYADPAQGHLGKIYQAGNWLYLGESSKSLFYEIGGELIHSRTANPNNKQFGSKSRDYDTSGARKIFMPPKHKYLFPLTLEVREKFLPVSKEYPRRVGSVTSSAPAVQAGGGGASPTPTLKSFPKSEAGEAVAHG